MSPQFPKMVKIEQILFSDALSDVTLAETVAAEFRKLELHERIRAGQRIAIGVGSRGIDRISEVIRLLVEQIQGVNAHPFIFPAMGSHGGATAEGQVNVLTALGITRESIGCPILSSMEVDKLGETAEGLPVYLDSYAAQADGYIIVNRIKPHTNFDNFIESGLMKMLAIGAGKERQASTIHSYGQEGLRYHLLRVARTLIHKSRFLGGFAIVENGYHRIYKIVACKPSEMENLEIKLLGEAKSLIPILPVEHLDILVVDYIGKDISGTGMDTNIIGRKDGLKKPVIHIILARDLTVSTNGNATGIGYADLTVRRLVDKIDYSTTYRNTLAGGHLRGGMLPVVLDTDREAITSAIKIVSGGRSNDQIHIIRIQDTLTMHTMQVSSIMVSELSNNSRIRIIGEPQEMRFDSSGQLLSL